MIKIGTQTPISDILPPPGWEGRCVSEKKTGRFLWFPHDQNPSPNSVFGANALLSVILVQFSQIPRAIYLNVVVLQNINLHNSRPIIFMVPTRQYQFNFFTFFRKFISMVFFKQTCKREAWKGNITWSEVEDSIRSSLPPWKGTRVYILTVSLHTVSRLQILFSCISVSKPSLKQVIFSDKRRYRRKTAKFYLLWFEFPRCFEGFWWM